MAAAEAITPGRGGGGGEAPPAVAPHLDDGVVSDILHRLPTKDAYGLTVVCPRWREIVSGPAFLSRHLSPRPLPLLDHRPRALILQPRRKIGYTHLTLVPTDPADSFALNLPLDPKYTSKSEESRRLHKVKPPTPDLCDTAADNFILSGLYSTGADDDVLVELDKLPSGVAVDEVRDGEALEDPDQPADQSADADVPGEETAPPLQVEAEDYAVFFERTVPLLDISVVASHGRLLLGRSRTGYYVCDPAANRWLALPPPPIPPTRDTASGLHYDLDAATGRVSFTVVLLVGHDARARRAGRGAAASPGIRVGTCFYWLSRRRGHVVRYDVARGRASVVRDPPETEGSKGRAWRSLGSAGGRLRLCAFDIRDEESSNMLPHDGVEGVYGVWAMDPAGAWRRVHEAVVEDLSTYYFNMLWGLEMALDFAGACSDSIIVDKDEFLLRGRRQARRALRPRPRIPLL
ncbi:hypothetical protein C2845_PM07G38190 [Panicum miliaceum]|uniref:F-box domain-containing protein n=1 Tax=Panicum miliaceum TaxID=4540 RepID=A0A3L6SM00_PANMI|nr:hypothetical protein C2845_PM07G38190 [Panicum miliaceum]